MTNSVRVEHRDSHRHYPRCFHQDGHDRCRIGATYLVPQGAPQRPLTWLWVPQCAAHYTQWMSTRGWEFPIQAAFKIQPLAHPRSRLASVPRKEYE